MEVNAVEEAVQKLGGPSQVVFLLARLGYRLSVNGLWKWRQTGRVSDAMAAVYLHRLSGIPVEKLAGADSAESDGGPQGGQRFPEGGPMTSATYPGSRPAVPRYPEPDTAARAA